MDRESLLARASSAVSSAVADACVYAGGVCVRPAPSRSRVVCLWMNDAIGSGIGWGVYPVHSVRIVAVVVDCQVADPADRRCRYELDRVEKLWAEVADALVPTLGAICGVVSVELASIDRVEGRSADDTGSLRAVYHLAYLGG